MGTRAKGGTHLAALVRMAISKQNESTRELDEDAGRTILIGCWR